MLYSLVFSISSYGAVISGICTKRPPGSEEHLSLMLPEKLLLLRKLQKLIRKMFNKISLTQSHNSFTNYVSKLKKPLLLHLNDITKKDSVAFLKVILKY